MRPVKNAARADADYKQLSRAMAMVTPLMIVLGSINLVLLPASNAEGSATAGSFTLSATNCEWRNDLVVERISSALMNRRLSRVVQTVFLMTDYKWMYLSSTIVKEVALHGGNVKGLVPEPVLVKLAAKYETLNEDC